MGAENVKALIPDSRIRINAVDFTSLLFRQIDRINESSSYLYSAPLATRREAMLAYRKNIFNLQAMMLAKLRHDENFVAERDVLNLKKPETYAFLSSSNLESVLKFDFVMEQWYELLMDHMKKFNFYPPTDTGFISGKKEIAPERIREGEE